MPTVFEPAPEVRRVGQKMIDKWHPDLRATRIEYIFREKASKRHGKRVGGTARKVTGAMALLATPGAQSSEDLPFFLITIAKDVWDTLDDRKREALVDHELEHCSVEVDDEGDATLSMRPHDIEEFGSIVGRHGLWSNDLEWFVTSLPAEQLDLLGAREDVAMTISHARADGTVESVDTTTGELTRAANLLRHGVGIVDADRAQRIMDGEEDAGQSPADGPDPEF